MILSGGNLALIDCIKVNADYESVLFRGRPGPVANHAIEFLAFYLQDLPLLTEVSYSPEYLERIRKVSGRNPRVTSKGKAINWWGPLKDPERERWLNSKITSARLSEEEGWSSARIMTKTALRNLRPDKELIIKDPFGMSGRGLISALPGAEVHLPNALPEELIVEPKLDRKFDFSHFVFPDGRMICYENLVDDRFQYRGTILEDTSLTTESLSFAHLIDDAEWEKFHKALSRIREFYGSDSLYGYSVDSFVYEENGVLRIYPLSEINARRTMGLLAYEFFREWGTDRRTALSLKKPLFPESVKLSPEDSFFDIYLSFE